jgi:2-haloacid dehalogenase
MPFNQLIPLALQDALAEHSILTKMNETEIAALTSAYLELPVSPDVRPFLTSLSDDKSLHHKFARHTYVHANAPLSVMDALITANSGTLGVFFDSPKYIKSVDTTVKKFKPHKDAYVDFALSAGVQDKDCVLITSHSWDVVGAKRAGWRTVWVDRGGEGWCDGLGRGMGIHPDWTIKSLQDMGNVFSVM